MQARKRPPCCGASVAASGAAAEEGFEFSEVAEPVLEYPKWRDEHPTRNYAQLEEVPGASPHGRPHKQHIPGRVYPVMHRSKKGKSAGGAASGASASAAGEYVCVPFAAPLPGDGPVCPVGPVGSEPQLFLYPDPVTGQTHQHSTFIERMAALAETHPLAPNKEVSRAFPQKKPAKQSTTTRRDRRART